MFPSPARPHIASPVPLPLPDNKLLQSLMNAYIRR